MKSYIFLTTYICLLANVFAMKVGADDASPPCYRQLQVDFFNQDLVIQALSLFKVQQPAWRLIAQDLSLASRNVPAIVQYRARFKNPNPLDPVFDPNGAIQVLQDSLYEVCNSVMKRYTYLPYNMINQNTINGVFRYVWDHQQSRIQACFR